MKKLISVLLCLILLQPVFASFSSDTEEYLLISKKDWENLKNLSEKINFVSGEKSRLAEEVRNALIEIYWNVRRGNVFNQDTIIKKNFFTLEEELKFLKDKIDLLEKKILKLELDKLSEGL